MGGFGTAFAIHNSYVGGYWGAAINEASLKNHFNYPKANQETITNDISRDIQAIQGSAGLSVPINANFKYQPYLSLGYADIDIRYYGPLPSEPDKPNYQHRRHHRLAHPRTALQQWFDKNRIEIKTIYIINYTDSHENLDTSGTGHNGIITFRWSMPTHYRSQGKPWWWNVYYRHVNLINQDPESLGFKYYNELALA